MINWRQSLQLASWGTAGTLEKVYRQCDSAVFAILSSAMLEPKNNALIQVLIHVKLSLSIQFSVYSTCTLVIFSLVAS